MTLSSAPIFGAGGESPGEKMNVTTFSQFISSRLEVLDRENFSVGGRTHLSLSASLSILIKATPIS